MRLLSFVAALILLAELVGAVVFAAHGSWLIAGLLLAGFAVVAFVLRLVLAETKQPSTPGYVERERQFY